MSHDEEKELLIRGINLLKNELIFTHKVKNLEILERLENLRNCLELLLNKELARSARTPL